MAQRQARRGVTIARSELIQAVDHALAGDWEAAHTVVQRDESDPTSCWIHAVLHKLEPDESNSRYWYRRAGKSYEAYADGRAELAAIKAALTY
jgi:hypothetical protein